MKNVDPKRFQAKKPEEISFNGAPLSENPQKKEGSVRTDVRTSVRSDEKRPQPAPESEAAALPNVYTIEVPAQRRKIRHPFDIHEDQLEALKKIQIAEREEAGGKERTLGDMAREALDDFIEGKARKLANIEISYEKDKSASVRTDGSAK